MLSIQNISKSYGDRAILDAVSATVSEKDKIGLIGRNGAGKTTLLNLICSFEQLDTGQIEIPSNYTLGYLQQSIKNNSQKTVFNESISAFKEAITLKKDIQSIQNRLEKPHNSNEELSDLLDKLQVKTERFEVIGGYKIEQETEQVLLGLGFLKKDFDKKYHELSGGWQMRVELAKLLLQKPNILLLDEPTNHLDIESILWFENYLKHFSGIAVIVSHDKLFLDNVTNRTIEIINGKIFDYPVSYTPYLELRQERIETQQATAENQEKYIQQQMAFVNRFRAKATKAKQVQSKLKQIEKIEKVQIDDFSTESIYFKFPEAPRSGDVVVNVLQLYKSYGENQVLKDVSLVIRRHEKVAFVGKNGQGKSTMSRILIGEEVCKGKCEIGYNVSIGYYAQVQENTLNPNDTVFDTIANQPTEENMSISAIRSLLGMFLFSDDDVDKKVSVLSGGEKSRLALAKLLLVPTNLLILDEPTNHLDIISKNILKQALQNYNGTLILVSHDRDFLDGLTDKTYYFKDKNIKLFQGDINYFLEKQSVDSFRKFELKNTKTDNGLKNSKKNKTNNEYLERKEKSKQIRKTEKEIAELEQKINQIELVVSNLEEEMHQPDFYKNVDISAKKTKEYNDLKVELDTILEKWEAKVLDLENLKEA